MFQILVLLSVIEVFCQTFGQRYWDKDVAAILYLLAGLGIGIIPLIKIKKSKSATNYSVISSLFVWIGYGLVFAICLFLGAELFRNQPLDYTFADMLPIIEIMGQRWISGAAVYEPIPEIWGGVQPPYLPALWLPYVPLVATGIEMRFVNVLFLLVPIGMTLFLVANRRKTPLSFLTIVIPILTLLGYVFINYSTLITISEEPIVIGFYLLLAVTIARKWDIGQGILLACCAMSRYMLVFWAVVYVLYLFFAISRKRALIITATGILTTLVLLWISQGIYHLDLFISLKDNYLETLQNPDRQWGIINTIQKNIGLARFVPFEGLPTLHTALFWGSLVLPVVLYLFYHFFGRKWIALELFALCSLKLCLVYFFNMNALPFSYLFYTSTVLSIAVLALVYRNEIIHQHLTHHSGAV